MKRRKEKRRKGERKTEEEKFFRSPFLLFSLLLSSLLLLSSCSGVYQMMIEVQEPAQVTLPMDAGRVMIVNNTVKQPSTSGITRMYNGRPVEGYEITLESVAWVTTESLAANVEDSHFFDAVSYYKKPVREDDEWLANKPLSQSFRNKLFEAYEVDVLVSIDRILFKLEENSRNPSATGTNDAFYAFEIKTEVQTNCSVYLYGKDNPLTSFAVSDSLSYDAFLSATTYQTIVKEIPEAMIDHLAYVVGEDIAYSIIPSWTTKERLLYPGSNSRMREAFSYSKTDKWNTAQTIWLSEYEKKIKNSDKGKIATNLAVSNELNDQLAAALRWAEKAKAHFLADNVSNKSEEMVYIEYYISDLQKRLVESRILDVQFGKEDY
jgi:hypothetical protein